MDKKKQKKVYLEINLTRKQAEYMKKHLAKEHPITKGKMKIEK